MTTTTTRTVIKEKFFVDENINEREEFFIQLKIKLKFFLFLIINTHTQTNKKK